MMTKEPKAGEKVSWNSHGGEAHGKVVKKVTKPMTIKGHKVAASNDNPEFLVETDDGKRAAHKPGALKKG
jgi:Hypervirulence associated proteins TUDOR domain